MASARFRPLPALILWLPVLFLFGLVGCGGDPQRGDKLRVVTTATMVTDLIKRIGGEHVEVKGLMGEAVDPHSYEPIATDLRDLQRADAIFYLGLHLEGKMQASFEALADQGRPAIAVADGVPESELLAPQRNFPGAYDPHIWGDPRLWRHCANYVAEKLAELDPAHAQDYRDNVKDYSEELDTLYQWGRKRINEIPESQRILVSSHDAFFYFGRAYGIEVHGLQGLSTDSEVGLGGRRKLIEFLRSRPVKAVFGETSVNEKGIAGVARQAGVDFSDEKLYSDAMGSRGDMAEFNGESYDRGTYLGMQKHNINALVRALK